MQYFDKIPGTFLDVKCCNDVVIGLADFWQYFDAAKAFRLIHLGEIIRALPDELVTEFSMRNKRDPAFLLNLDVPAKLAVRKAAIACDGNLRDAVPRALHDAIDDILPGSRRLGLGIHSYIEIDRKSTRLNSSHVEISYAVFCLKKKKKKTYKHQKQKKQKKKQIKN